MLQSCARIGRKKYQVLKQKKAPNSDEGKKGIPKKTHFLENVYTLGTWLIAEKVHRYSKIEGIRKRKCVYMYIH